MLALNDGYTQGKIGRYLGVTSGLISKVSKSYKLNT